ncbi:PIG-L family deacetylase [Segetibacter koreensis]|uniref:PIG-L family deacetylase n=1 Tax=Segetibacter koreensis TaxID=398037 RepID=UPI0004761AD7|nr:PIG-L family deacetylase [Segetibacter koreensis]
MMRILKLFLLIAFFFHSLATFSQTPPTFSSADIYMQLKKLNVLASVLYIAAHPDDENNTLLPYLAKEKLYRTGYLSLTRGDGGQNLIGSEQGIELGLIRTQELLAARRIDGAEQFFSRAYEFGFSKNADEALRIWGKDKILSDVVWVIRKYQPDIIIKRFPPDKRAGHGHHAASAILADEAFTAAADPNRFAEQFKYGVKPWQAKRIFWNTFNFGGNNTTSEDQLKIDVGGYNPLIGESYGELGGEARSMHKSQGEGRPRRRGEIFEYFQTTGGNAPKSNDLMDGIVTDWKRIPGGEKIETLINEITANFKFDNPALSVSSLVTLYNAIKALPESNWRDKKLAETQDIIEECAGLFTEATTNKQFVVQGDVLDVTLFLNNRKSVNATVKRIKLNGFDTTFSSVLSPNEILTINKKLPVSSDKNISQPYWLVYPQLEGSFDVRDQELIGKAENDPVFEATFTVNISGTDFIINRPVQYKVTDLAKGELYEPLAVLPKIEFNYVKDNYLSLNGKPVTAPVHVRTNFKDNPNYIINQKYSDKWASNSPSFNYAPGNNTESYLASTFTAKSKELNTTEVISLSTSDGKYDGFTKIIAYDHIPTITYFPKAKTNLVKPEIKIVGKKVGYIIGAGDKVPDALTAMGFNVTFLNEGDINSEYLQQFDAVIVGVRAHNIYGYLSTKNDIFNRYIQNGGNLIVQYMKSSQSSNAPKVGPYPFNVTSTRVTEENAKVNFLLPNHPAFNYPNKITAKDFEGWVQERSTYQADVTDEHYEKLIGMNDTGEQESNGSLVIAKYGKGNFAYVSLVLFRQLPAGVPGAYRLLANLIALPKNK